MSLLTRRRLVTSIAAVALPGWSRAQPVARTLRLRHLHTGERLGVEYFADGRYEPQALAEINRVLRDFRTGEVAPIDPTLLDLLHAVAGLTGTAQPFEIVSAYRSPATNAQLREHSRGVARGSLHLKGQAIDVRLADVELATLRRAALTLRGGGVGYYPGSNFVHVDTGRVRTW